MKPVSCSNCGNPLPSGAALPLCPKCMLAPASGGETATESEGTRLGSYDLLEEIGEGGFGIVYLAEQREPVRRKVALKILKPGMDTRKVVARFEAERQTLAMLDHPNIATVHDGDVTESGRPYFVMEYVNGVPVTRHCVDHALELGTRLRLFLDICRAVQHAHQKGVIHRDLKPGNVLVATVDNAPVPKVIDFGIAKAIGEESAEGTQFTMAGQMIGTPDYMSPEQASADPSGIDTRSDVYSLGALLYELLAGRPVIDNEKLRTASQEEVRRMIRDTTPLRPSQHSDSSRRAPLPDDLDWITMKALEKERGRRYQSVSELAADIERFLRDEPVEARPPSPAYLLRRFASRHRVALGVSAAMLAVLVTALVFSIGQAVRATKAGEAAKKSETEAVIQLQEAEYQRETAELISDYLSRILMNPHPEMEDSALTIGEMLANAEKGVATDFRSRPDIQLRLYQTLASTYSGLGMYKAELRVLDSLKPIALADMEGKRATGMSRAGYAVTDLAYRNHLIGRADLARELYAAVREAVTERHSHSYVEATLGLGKNARQHDLGTAAVFYEEAFDIMSGWPDRNERQWLSSTYELGAVYGDLGRFEEAMPLLREAYSRARKMPHLPEAFWSFGYLVRTLDKRGETDELRELCLETYAEYRDALGASHDHLIGIAEITVNHLGKSDTDTAVTFINEHVEAVAQELPGDHPRLLQARHVQAGFLAGHGRAAKAASIFEAIYGERSRILGEFHGRTLATLSGWVEAVRADPEKRKQVVGKLRLTLDRVMDDDTAIEPGVHANLLHTLGGLELEDGKTGAANRCYRHRFELVRGQFGPNDVKTHFAQRDLAYVCMKDGQHAEARELIETALAAMERVFAPDHAALALARD